MLYTEMSLEHALARVSKGDARAFRRVYELTKAHLFSQALRIVKRRELAEDVLQDVYVKVWDRAHQYDPSVAKPMTWLIAMVQHRAIDLLRARRGEMDSLSYTTGGTLPDDEVTEAAGTEDGGARAVDSSRIGICLQRLNAQHRQAVALAYYQGLTHAEVASHLCVPLGSVKGWLHRGLDHLRRSMEVRAA
jgi:RNA polymerase sigma-70 factor, ECF subfamily